MSLIVEEKGKIDHKIKLKWSDEFWLVFLCLYAGLMEGMIPVPRVLVSPISLTLKCPQVRESSSDAPPKMWRWSLQFRKPKIGLTIIPVFGNSVQMFFSPIIMVGIPKWIRCPPSVMCNLWGHWFLLTLTAYVPVWVIQWELTKRYIPGWGTYRYANRAPITKVNSRLSTYLLLRRLLSESDPIGKSKGQKAYRSKHLTEYLGQEVTYSKSLHKDISGDWTSCCSCLW